jgi:proteasome assembly chaperone (PAC2) family protein
VDYVQYTGPTPLLRRPVLIAAFRGWNDAGECASAALESIDTAVGGTPFAELDPEEFFDFQVSRPTVHPTGDGARHLEWPINQFSWGSLPGTDRDVVLLDGTEPNLRWRTFVRTVLDVAARLDVELVVTLGALQIDVPHTRPTPLSGRATAPDLAERIGLRQSSYEGPTGITGVLHQAVSDAGLPGVSLWAGVPHYLAGASFAAGTLAIVETVTKLLAADFGLDDLARDAAVQRDEIADLVAEDDDLARYVADLESRVDIEGPGDSVLGAGDLPASDVSGDELAEQLERYLRDHDTGS